MRQVVLVKVVVFGETINPISNVVRNPLVIKILTVEVLRLTVRVSVLDSDVHPRRSLLVRVSYMVHGLVLTAKVVTHHRVLVVVNVEDVGQIGFSLYEVRPVRLISDF